jgi:hypothetical protein
MKGRVDITAQALGVDQDRAWVHTVVVITRKDRPHLTIEEGRWVEYFGNPSTAAEEVHKRLTGAFARWLYTGINDSELLGYGLE